MLLNTVLIILLLAAVVVGLNYYIKKVMRVETDSEDDGSIAADEDEITIEYLTKEVALEFSRATRRNFRNDNLSRKQLQQKEKQVSSLRAAITNASNGDRDAKRVVKSFIKQILLRPKYDIEKNADRVLSLKRPERLFRTDVTNIVLYLYMQKFGEYALDELVNEYDLLRETMYDGEKQYIITTDVMQRIYKDVVLDGNSQLGQISLTLELKLEILSQKIFQRYIGLDAIDLLYELSVDEIDVGTSGIPKDSFVISSAQKNMPFSYESIWILLHGKNVHMQCMAFESQYQLIRVCDNIYKYDAPGVMSQEKGYIVATTKDGYRVVAFRPPFADSYGFTMRKFDSAPSVAPWELVKDEDNFIPLVIIMWGIKALLNTIISGQQATGKTTFLKSAAKWIPPQYNLRIQEIQSELNLRYTYPNRNIIGFQETASIDSQEGLNLQKKTNGGVNITGEIAAAIQSVYFIQTANVASYMAIATHHGKDEAAVINGIGNDLLNPTVGIYQSEENAIKKVAEILNLNVGLVNDGSRHIAYVSEIIPTNGEAYPSERMGNAGAADKVCADASVYMKKRTDPEWYKINRMVEWQPILDEDGERIGGKFVLNSIYSEAAQENMLRKLPVEERDTFRHDMAMLLRYKDGDRSEEMMQWTKTCVQW